MIKTSLNFRLTAPTRGGIEIDPSAPHSRGRSTAGTGSRPRICDNDAAAGIYISDGTRLRYLGFPKAWLAVSYANEELKSRQLLSCAMEVDDDRFDSTEIQGLYRSDRYPFRGEKALDT